MKFTDKMIRQINKTIGFVFLIISLIIIYFIFERFLNQGFFDGKTHGAIYEHHIKLKDWLSIFILSCSLALIGISLFFRKKLAYYLLYLFTLGLLLDRIIIIISYTEVNYFFEITLPICITIAMIIYFNFDSVKRDFGFLINKPLLVFYLILGGLIAILPKILIAF